MEGFESFAKATGLTWVRLVRGQDYESPGHADGEGTSGGADTTRENDPAFLPPATFSSAADEGDKFDFPLAEDSVRIDFRYAMVDTPSSRPSLHAATIDA